MRHNASRYYPIFLALEGRTCLIVGGGEVGERKARSLLKYGAIVRVVATELSAWFVEQCSARVVHLAGRHYDKAQLEGVCLVFAATSDMELNRTVAADARHMGIWCNMASNPELGSFILPSVVERGPLSIAISTAGLSPAVAKLLRRKLEDQIGTEWDFFILLLGGLRDYFKSRGSVDREGRGILSKVAAIPIPELLKTEGGPDRAFAMVSEICGPAVPRAELQTMWESLWKPFSS
jgi:precorrin-2 dehydrogenase/sirohydrochlorin ferrochelatase